MLVGGPQVPGHLRHGDDGGQAVVPAARAAHDGVGAPAHAPLGAGGHPGHRAAEEVVSHGAGGQLPFQRPGDSDARVVFQPEIRQALVHVHAFQHKGQLLFGALLHQGPNLRHRHGFQPVVKRVPRPGGPGLFKQDLTVFLGEYDVGMRAPDDTDAGSVGGNHLRPGVELGLLVPDGHRNAALLHQRDGLAGNRASKVLQKPQALFRVAQAGPQGGGVPQPHFGEAGNTHAHAVFVDAGIDLQLHGDDFAAGGAGGVRCGQGRADRLRAAQGGDHLLAQQGQQFFLCNHGKAPLYKQFCVPVLS